MVGGHELRRHKANSGQNPGIPEKPPGLSEIPGRVRPTYAAHDAISPSPRASALLTARNACSSTRTVPCAAAMRVLRRLRRCGGRGMPMAVRTMRLQCVLLQDRGGAWHGYALLRSQSAHRNEAAQQAGCCQQGPMLPTFTRGSFKEDQHTQAALTCVCLSLRRFVRTIWLDVAEVRSRSSNENRKRRMLRRRLL